LNHQVLAFYERALRLPTTFSIQSSATQTEILLAILLFRESLTLCPPTPPWTRQTSLWPLSSKAAPAPTQADPMLQPTSSILRVCGRMNWWLCSLAFGCWCPRSLKKMIILLFAVLLSWPYLL